MEWKADQEFEATWWGNCVNTFGEETKQITYAHRMGLTYTPYNGQWPSYNLPISVIDLGGGPVSMLLKCRNILGTVVDPCNYPNWIAQRYNSAGIRYIIKPAEEFTSEFIYDECWIYNVLQHVINPEQIIHNARSFSKLIRIFEWIDLPPHPGHPHELKEEKLNLWLKGTGKTEQMNENGCYGKAYYGIFKTDK